jgi:hypothetical protein
VIDDLAQADEQVESVRTAVQDRAALDAPACPASSQDSQELLAFGHKRLNALQSYNVGKVTLQYRKSYLRRAPAKRRLALGIERLVAVRLSHIKRFLAQYQPAGTVPAGRPRTRPSPFVAGAAGRSSA